MSELRCIHRHTIETHPNCFKKGLIKKENWWEDKTIAYFDLETTGFQADIGEVLSWCIKYKGDNRIRYSVITKKELFDLKFDERVVRELVEELYNIDILVTYFGKSFDVRFLRAKAAFYGIEFPKYGSIYHWDLYYHVKKDFKLTRKSLDRVTHYLGIDGKTPLDISVWRYARYGDPKALKEVLKHNKGDVEILEELHERIGDYSKWIKTSI